MTCSSPPCGTRRTSLLAAVTLSHRLRERPPAMMGWQRWQLSPHSSLSRHRMPRCWEQIRTPFRPDPRYDEKCGSPLHFRRRKCGCILRGIGMSCAEGLTSLGERAAGITWPGARTTAPRNQAEVAGGTRSVAITEWDWGQDRRSSEERRRNTQRPVTQTVARAALRPRSPSPAMTPVLECNTWSDIRSCRR